MLPSSEEFYVFSPSLAISEVKPSKIWIGKEAIVVPAKEREVFPEVC